MRHSKWLLCLLLGALLLAAPIRADDEEEEEVTDGDVKALTSKDFDDVVGKSKFALVMFYAPWCGHCKSMKPAYGEAATALKESLPDVVLAKVDATQEEELGKKFEVQGYPTLKWFVDGKLAMDYSGGRDKAGIISWITKKTGPPSVTASTLEELDKAKADAKVAVLAFLTQLKGDVHDAFEDFAKTRDDVTFIKTESEEVAKAFGLEKPGFALGRNYKDHDFVAVAAEGHEAFEEGKPLAEQLAALIKAERLPDYLEFNQDNGQDIFQGGVNKQVIIIASEEELAKDGDLVKAIKAAAPEFRGKLIYVTTVRGSEHYKPIFGFFGLSEYTKGIELRGFDAAKNKKYETGEGFKFSAEKLKEFTRSVLDGTAAQIFKSAEPPSDDKAFEDGVAVIVGKTFDEIVKDPTKDVLLEVYAPWCGHCKQLTPIYAKLAKRFANVGSVVIAKMDGTENEHPDIHVEGFPTILFFPAEEDADPIPFDGQRTLAGMTKFLKEKAKVPFELPKKKKKGEEKTEEKADHSEL